MDDKTERRVFLTQALALVGGCMCAGWISGCESDVLKSSGESVQFDVGSAPALAQVGGSVKQVFEGQNGGRARDHFSRCRRKFCGFEFCVYA